MAKSAVWNITIPHTSPMIAYTHFDRDCPTERGVQLCHREGSGHIADQESGSSAKQIAFQFYGTAVYLYGSVTAGIEYTARIDSQEVTGVPDGDLLVKFENLSNFRTASTKSIHQFELRATRTTAAGVLKFTKAEISIDAGTPKITQKTTSYNMTDPNVKLSAGWSKSGEYMRANEDFAQKAEFSFNGSAVLVYGMCTNTLETEHSKGYYGYVQTDAMFTREDMTESYYNNNSLLHRTEDCLLFWDTRFSEGKHNLTLEPEKYTLLLKRFDVVSIEGGNNTQSTNKPSGSTDTGNKSSGGFSLSTTAIIGIIVAAVVIFISGLTYMLRRCRSNRARIYAVPAQPQLSAHEDPNKYLVTPSAAPTHQIVHHHLTYQPPVGYQQPYHPPIVPVPVASPPLPQPQPRLQPQVEPTVHYPGQNAPYNPFGVERHQPQAISSQHSLHATSQPTSTPLISSPYSATATLTASDSRHPASSDAASSSDRTTSPDPNLASHFAGRTVLAADGTYNYVGGARPTKEASYSAPVTRPQEPYGAGAGSGSSAGVAPVQIQSAQPVSQPQSQYQQYQAQQQQPVHQPTVQIEQSAQQQFQPGHAPQGSADIPDLPPPVYEETAARR